MKDTMANEQKGVVLCSVEKLERRTDSLKPIFRCAETKKKLERVASEGGHIFI